MDIHPSLLPNFPGPQAYRQAYERGVNTLGDRSQNLADGLARRPTR